MEDLHDVSEEGLTRFRYFHKQRTAHCHVSPDTLNGMVNKVYDHRVPNSIGQSSIVGRLSGGNAIAPNAA